jgi:malonyl-CoA decarboxylase
MVNYLYDLARIEVHHEKFTRGEVAYSRSVAALL